MRRGRREADSADTNPATEMQWMVCRASWQRILKEAFEMRDGLSEILTVQRASTLFLIEETGLISPFVEKIWRTRSEPAEAFISVAANYSQLVFTRQNGRTFVTIRGPETKPTIVPIPQDAEFIGIQFRPGVYIPGFPSQQLVDSSLTFPESGRQSFLLNSSVVEVPVYDNVDAFIEHLARQRLLVRDPIVEAVLDSEVTEISARSVQRRFLTATGLTQGTFRQIQRARQAAQMLDCGLSILDVVQQAGYADQAHLTRSLRRFIGPTPAHIVRERISQ
jgi:AraC-like DNA-binding protein